MSTELHSAYYEVVRHILLDNWRYFFPKVKAAFIGNKLAVCCRLTQGANDINIVVQGNESIQNEAQFTQLFEVVVLFACMCC